MMMSLSSAQQATISTGISSNMYASRQHGLALRRSVLAFVLLLLERGKGDTAMPGGLYARLRHAFLVSLVR